MCITPPALLTTVRCRVEITYAAKQGVKPLPSVVREMAIVLNSKVQTRVFLIVDLKNSPLLITEVPICQLA
jgi:hypothetical protein